MYTHQQGGNQANPNPPVWQIGNITASEELQALELDLQEAAHKRKLLALPRYCI